MSGGEGALDTPGPLNGTSEAFASFFTDNNYLLTYDSYVSLYNRFHRGERITRVSGGEGALDTPWPLNGTIWDTVPF